MTEPRNVTPDGESREDEFHRRYYGERREGPEWAGWSWANRGSSFPWLGVLLVLVGIGLLVQLLFPTVGAGSLVLLAIAVALLAGWLLSGAWFGMAPGLLVLALAITELIEDAAIFAPSGDDVPGLASSALAIAFGLIWLIGHLRGRTRRWPLWGLAIFGLIAVAQVSGQITTVPGLQVVWPIAIIVLGVLVLVASRRR
ncbi:hypothetical protein BH24CHL5_BH24CHL5_03350 [soil metagenome]